MKKVLIFLFITSLPFICLAQQPQENAAKTVPAVEWTRVQNDTGEFSIEMPSDFVYFYDKDGFTYDHDPNKTYHFAHMQMLNAASEKTVMRVEIYKVSSSKSYLEELIEREKFGGVKSNESQDGFTIRQFSQNKQIAYRAEKETPINFVVRVIASKSFLYVVTVANRGAASQTATRFLSSIRLNQPVSEAGKIVSLSTLKPLTIDQIGEKVDDEKIPKLPQTTKPVEIPENPVIILTRPHATYTEEARNAGITGKILLRLKFEKDGRISKIGVIKSLEKGLLRNAFFASLRIKFIPQEKDDELQTITKTVTYSFDIY